MNYSVCRRQNRIVLLPGFISLANLQKIILSKIREKRREDKRKYLGDSIR